VGNRGKKLSYGVNAASLGDIDLNKTLSHLGLRFSKYKDLVQNFKGLEELNIVALMVEETS
jgi:hypothetical protein